MNPDFLATVELFLYWLHERELRCDDPTSLAQFGKAYQRLTQLAREADRVTQDQCLHLLRSALTPEQSNWEFGSLANTCGMIVEFGGDPTLAIAPILDRITNQLERVPEFVEVMQTQLGIEQPNQVAEQDWPRLGETHPDHAWVIGEWHALRFTGCAAVTMLCRSVQERKRARERIGLMQAAEKARIANPFAFYLAELLGTTDDESLLVLDLTRRLGFRVRLTAIRNNFHLFTLLQDALLSHPTGRGWQGPSLGPSLVAVAKGERMLSDISPNEGTGDPLRDSALWNYCPYLPPKPDEPTSLIWGEGKPSEIPTTGGEHIVLLKPLEFHRSWEVSFFAPLHSALRSSVVIEECLGEDEYRAWLSKIGVD